MHHEFIAISIIFYSLFALTHRKGWSKAITQNDNYINTNKQTSIIVATRNEEVNIINLLKSLKSQSVPKHLLEIIIVDDHSSDNTWTLLKKNTSIDENIKAISLPCNLAGKKSAIQYGISKSKGDLVLLTDADCTHNTYWAQSMINAIESTNKNMIIGPVIFTKKHGLFNSIIRLEFISLISTTIAFASINRPIMCNGANIIVQRELIHKYYNSKRIESISGDDMYLLMFAKKESPYKIGIHLNDSATVVTAPPNSLNEFFQQRIRWASKNNFLFKDKDVLITTILIAIINITLLFSLLTKPIYFVGIWVAKSLIDIIILRRPLVHFNQKDTLHLIPLLNTIYPFYLFLTGIIASVFSYNWKQRKIKKGQCIMHHPSD